MTWADAPMAANQIMISKAAFSLLTEVSLLLSANISIATLVLTLFVERVDDSLAVVLSLPMTYFHSKST